MSIPYNSLAILWAFLKISNFFFKVLFSIKRFKASSAIFGIFVVAQPDIVVCGTPKILLRDI